MLVPRARLPAGALSLAPASFSFILADAGALSLVSASFSSILADDAVLMPKEI
jgi:hypothetical protein